MTRRQFVAAVAGTAALPLAPAIVRGQSASTIKFGHVQPLTGPSAAYGIRARDGALIATGKVGDGVTEEVATDCARQCALNAIAAIRSQAGDLASVRILKAVVFVASHPSFTGQPKVANGASELFGDVFGDHGVHARSAVGVPVLPLDAPVEVEVVAEILS